MTACDLRDEFVGCDFGDSRLSSRIIEMANVFQDNPGKSIPSAFVTRADWEACYRFFDNDSVKPELIIQPHIKTTHERVKERDVALLVQDTSELDLTRPKQQVRGAGPMECSIGHATKSATQALPKRKLLANILQLRKRKAIVGSLVCNRPKTLRLLALKQNVFASAIVNQTSMSYMH